MDDDTWGGISPAAITGYGGSQADSGSGTLATGLQMAAGTRADVHAPLYSPENPLFWFGALLAGAAGLVYVSARFKVGPVKASASA